MLFRSAPELDVVVLEAETAGFGASGRNGGWVVGELAGDRERWARRGGRDGVAALQRAIEATVDEVGRVAAAEGIPCAGWDSAYGQELLAGTHSLADLYKRSLDAGEPSPSSGRQEQLENLVARHVERAR